MSSPFLCRFPSIVPSLVCLAALTLGAPLLSGCGSGGRTIAATREQAPTNFYYGKTYIATGLTAGDLGGNLSLTVRQDGTAHGTLPLSVISATRAQVHARTRQSEDDSTGSAPTGDDTVFTTTSASYDVTLSGSFDAATGKFTLTGNYIVGGDAVVPITLTGTLPTPPQTTGGTIFTEINGTTYPPAAFTSVFDLGATL